MKAFSSILIFTILLSANAFSAASPVVTVQGLLMGFDDNVIRIRTSATTVVNIPRKTVDSLDGFIAGKAKITVKVNVTDLLALNK